MIKGLDKFKAHFAQHTKSFVLIGGVACHEWLATQGLEFRATRDIDIVLIVEPRPRIYRPILGIRRSGAVRNQRAGYR